MIEFLTSDSHKIILEEGTGSFFKRNSDSFSGGDEITVEIQNPDKQFVSGVKITLFPFIPDQGFGKDQVFNPIVKEKHFDTRNSTIPILSEIPVNPAFSYRISVSYSTKYGYLSPSENVTSPGEFQKMMEKHVGCYIKESVIKI